MYPHFEKGGGKKPYKKHKEAKVGHQHKKYQGHDFHANMMFTVIFACIVCFLPEGSTNRQVNSSTEADMICNLGCVLGNVASKLRISSFSTFKHAILKVAGYEPQMN